MRSIRTVFILATLLLVYLIQVDAARPAPRGLLSVWPESERDAVVVSHHASVTPWRGSAPGRLSRAGHGKLGSPHASSDDIAEMHAPGNLAALASQPTLGGYVPQSGDAPASLEAARYAILKLNCARVIAGCAPLNRAHVLGAVSHVTAVDYWFLDIAVGANGRTVHATVAIDEVAKAQSEDLDCPDLNEEWVAFNLLKITENDEDMLDVCSITPETTAGAWSTLGGAGKTLEVTGQRRVFAPSRPWDLAAASEPASIGSDGANSEGCACAERGASLGSEIEFKLIDEGSCESAGMYTIMNEDTCRKAGEIVDNSPGKPVKVSENRIDRPKGCVLHNHQKGSADKPTELFLGGYLDGCEKGGYDCICVSTPEAEPEAEDMVELPSGEPKIEFKLIDEGSCESAGMYTIMNEDTCRKAGEIVDNSPGKPVKVSENRIDRPKGCVLHNHQKGSADKPTELFLGGYLDGCEKGGYDCICVSTPEAEPEAEDMVELPSGEPKIEFKLIDEGSCESAGMYTIMNEDTCRKAGEIVDNSPGKPVKVSENRIDRPKGCVLHNHQKGSADKPTELFLGGYLDGCEKGGYDCICVSTPEAEPEAEDMVELPSGEPKIEFKLIDEGSCESAGMYTIMNEDTCRKAGEIVDNSPGKPVKVSENRIDRPKGCVLHNHQKGSADKPTELFLGGYLDGCEKGGYDCICVSTPEAEPEAEDMVELPSGEPKIEFKLIDEGSCESAGMYTIMNEDTCRKAGEIVDNSPGKPVKVSENRIDRPKGCVLHNHQKGSADKPTELFLGGYLDGCELGGYDCICVSTPEAEPEAEDMVELPSGEPKIEFKLIDEGSCESAGMYTIMNEDTCRKAGEIVDNSPGKPVKVSENRIDRPKGCVLHNHQKGSADKPTELFLGGYLDGCEKGGYDCICVRMASRGGGGGGAFHDGGHRHAAMQHVVVDGTEPDAKVKPEHVPGPNPKPEPKSEPNNPDSVVMPDAKAEPDAMAGPDAKAEPDASAEPDAEAGPDAKAEPVASAEPDAMAEPDAKAEPVLLLSLMLRLSLMLLLEPDAIAEPEASAEPGAKAEPDAKAEPVLLLSLMLRLEPDASA